MLQACINVLLSSNNHIWTWLSGTVRGHEQWAWVVSDKTGTTLRNSRVLELLSYGTWLHRVWCTLVVSPVLDLPNGGSEICPRSARLSDVLACGGQEDGSHQDFRTRGVESKMIFELRYKIVICTVYIVLRYYCGGHTRSSVCRVWLRNCHGQY